MPDNATSPEPELLTITEAAGLLRAPVATPGTGATSARARAASASAAASSTATATSRCGLRSRWAEAATNRDPVESVASEGRPDPVRSLVHAACRTVPSQQ
jgi:hypothetical protein